MKALSERQATRCETASGSVCRCRCDGAFHGMNRSLNPDTEFFSRLPAEDPHHIDSQEERNAKRRADRREQRQAALERQQAELRAQRMKPKQGEYVPATCQINAPATPGALLLICQRALGCKRCGLCLVHCTCIPAPKPREKRKRMPDPRGRFEFPDAGDSPPNESA